MSTMTRRVQAWCGMVSSPRGWLGAVGKWQKKGRRGVARGPHTHQTKKPACVGGWGVGAAALIAPHCASQRATIDYAHHHDDALDRMVGVPPRGKVAGTEATHHYTHNDAWGNGANGMKKHGPPALSHSYILQPHKPRFLPQKGRRCYNKEPSAPTPPKNDASNCLPFPAARLPVSMPLRQPTVVWSQNLTQILIGTCLENIFKHLHHLLLIGTKKRRARRCSWDVRRCFFSPLSK